MNDPTTITDHERDYYEARAEKELELAQRAPHPAAVRSHYLLAESYLDLVHRRPEAPSDQAMPEEGGAQAD